MSQQSDMALLQRFANTRDSDAFAVLMRRHRNLVFGLCIGITRDQASADDACQDVFIELARQAKRIRGNITTWLYTVARRRAWRYRKQQVQSKSLPVEQEDIDQLPAVDLIEAVDAALAHLDERTRSALLQNFVEERSQEAIAADLHIHQSTVSRLIKDGSQQLRRHLGDAGIGTCSLGALQLLAQRPIPGVLVQDLGKLALAAPTLLAKGTGINLAFAVLVLLLTGALAWQWKPAPTEAEQSADIISNTAVAGMTADTGDDVPKTSLPFQMTVTDHSGQATSYAYMKCIKLAGNAGFHLPCNGDGFAEAHLPGGWYQLQSLEYPGTTCSLNSLDYRIGKDKRIGRVINHLTKGILFQVPPEESATLQITLAKPPPLCTWKGSIRGPDGQALGPAHLSDSVGWSPVTHLLAAKNNQGSSAYIDTHGQFTLRYRPRHFVHGYTWLLQPHNKPSLQIKWPGTNVDKHSAIDMQLDTYKIVTVRVTEPGGRVPMNNIIGLRTNGASTSAPPRLLDDGSYGIQLSSVDMLGPLIIETYGSSKKEQNKAKTIDIMPIDGKTIEHIKNVVIPGPTNTLPIKNTVTITCTTPEAMSAAQTIVRLEPTSTQDENYPYQATMTATGTAEFTGVRPGKYKLIATPPSLKGNKLYPKEQAITVPESGQVECQVNLNHGASLAVRVRTPHGQAAPWVNWILLHQDKQQSTFQHLSKTLTDGMLNLDAIKPGTYTLVVSNAYAQANRKLVLKENDHQTFTMTLIHKAKPAVESNSKPVTYNNTHTVQFTTPTGKPMACQFQIGKMTDQKKKRITWTGLTTDSTGQCSIAGITKRQLFIRGETADKQWILPEQAFAVHSTSSTFQLQAATNFICVVLDAAGSPVEHAAVHCWQGHRDREHGEEPWRIAWTDASGRCELTGLLGDIQYGVTPPVAARANNQVLYGLKSIRLKSGTTVVHQVQTQTGGHIRMQLPSGAQQWHLIVRPKQTWGTLQAAGNIILYPRPVAKQPHLYDVGPVPSGSCLVILNGRQAHLPHALKALSNWQPCLLNIPAGGSIDLRQAIPKRTRGKGRRKKSDPKPPAPGRADEF